MVLKADILSLNHERVGVTKGWPAMPRTKRKSGRFCRIADYAGPSRANPAQGPGGALYRRRRTGRLARTVALLRPGPEPGHDPERHGRLGRTRLRREPPHLRGTDSHPARLPFLRRHPAHGQAARP